MTTTITTYANGAIEPSKQASNPGALRLPFAVSRRHVNEYITIATRGMMNKIILLPINAVAKDTTNKAMIACVFRG